VPIDKDTLSSLIESIYECVLDRSQWTLTLERLAGVFHACNAIIFSQGVRELSFGFDWGVPAEAKIAYAEKYAAMDPMRTMDWHFEVDYPITLARFIGSQEFRKTKFYSNTWLSWAGLISLRSSWRNRPPRSPPSAFRVMSQEVRSASRRLSSSVCSRRMSAVQRIS
jgi:hypothetical protein